MKAGLKKDHDALAEDFRKQEIAAYDDYVLADDPYAKGAAQQRYNTSRELKAQHLRKTGMTDEGIESDNRRTTDVMGQMQRVHDKNLGTEFVDPKSPGAQDLVKSRYQGYLGDLGKILANMSDDELRAQPNVQKAIVDAYGGTYRNSLGTDESEGAFIPGQDGDLLRSMYGRLMGEGPITLAVRGGANDAAINTIRDRARETGVNDLMRRQYARAFGDEPGMSDLDRQANTMRSFWSGVVMPAATGSRRGVPNAADMNETLKSVTNDQVETRYRGGYIPRTEKDLTATAAGDYLLDLAPDNAVVRKGEIPKFGPPEPKTLDLTPEENQQLNEQYGEQTQEQPQKKPGLLTRGKKMLKRFFHIGK